MVRMAVPVVALTGMMVFVFCGTARADLDFSDGAWRLELRTMGGIHQGARDRSGDTVTVLGIDYEVPATRHGTLGLRLLPIFAYDPTEEGDPIFGAGLGLSARLYARGESYRGFFAEAECNTLFHRERIPANSSNMNFLLGFGAGYQFDGHLGVILRYQHISNGSLGHRNAGANAVGLGLSFRF